MIDIKTKYPALFTAITNASNNEIEGAPLIVTDSFVSYLALHFLVSLEKYREKESVKVVYVCSTGLGVTSLIQQRVKDEIPEVEIASFASILNLHEVIKLTRPDMIISIFPLEGIKLPWVKVSPIPTGEDIEKIQVIANDLMNQEMLQTELPKVRLLPREQVTSNVTAEDESREIIVKGFVLFEGLRDLFGNQLNEEYIESFLLHVFLMVHRVVYQHQYQTNSVEAKSLIMYHQELVIAIEEVFSANELAVNQSEIVALLQYLPKRSD